VIAAQHGLAVGGRTVVLDMGQVEIVEGGVAVAEIGAKGDGQQIEGAGSRRSR
jgi:hypothetical protein